MLYYYRIEVSELIDINKTSASKEFGIFQYCFFFYKGLSFNHMCAMTFMMY